MKNIWMLIGVFVLSAVLLSGCTSFEQPEDGSKDVFEGNESQTYTPSSVNSFENNTVPLETSNEVIATVNGEQIMSSDVTLNQQMLLQQGTQLTEDEVLNQIIIEIALRQKIESEGITVSTEEAEEFIVEQLAQQNLSLDDYKQQLAAQGATYSQELPNVSAKLFGLAN
jgi:parvulin-like peptidyl-prolyl isomerase